MDAVKDLVKPKLTNNADFMVLPKYFGNILQLNDQSFRCPVFCDLIVGYMLLSRNIKIVNDKT